MEWEAGSRQHRAPVSFWNPSPRGPISRFPDTRHSIVDALTDQDPDQRHAAYGLVVAVYRQPLLNLLRWRWNLTPEDAEDLVHDYFEAALSREWLAEFDPTLGRFRSFLRLTAERFAAKQAVAAGRLRRGGGSEHVSYDAIGVAASDGDADAERRFRDEWVRSILAAACDALEAEASGLGRDTHFALFRAYDLADVADTDRPSYGDLAALHGLSDSQVINHLAWARRRFRIHVLGVVRSLAGSEAEYREDVHDLLGIEAP